MSKLKPCPFCGRKAELHYYEIDVPFTFTECGYEIRCCHCDIRFKERLSRMPQFDEKADIKRQNLIERWNRRVNDGVESNEADKTQGEWIIEKDANGNTYGRCSICNMKQYAGQLNYCPDCGSRMKELINE